MAVTQTLSLIETAVDNVNNKSTVRMVWQSTQTGESWNGYERIATYWIKYPNGNEIEYKINYKLPQNTTRTILDFTFTVSHKDDGTGSVSVRTWMDTDISAGVIELTKTLNLTTIPRAATLDALTCSSTDFDGSFELKYTPKSHGYIHKLVISLNCNGTLTSVKTSALPTGKPEEKPTQQVSHPSLTPAERSTIYNLLPSTDKGTLRFTLTTYADSAYSKQIGDPVYKEITLYIPNDETTKPTATMTLTPVSSLPDTFKDLYIKGKSKVKVELTDAQGKYGATIVSCKATVAGKSGTTPYTSGYLGTVGSVTIKGTVTDTRGYLLAFSQGILVLDYAAPKLLPVSGEKEIICARCDKDGNLSESGTYLKIKVKRSYSKVNNKNSCYIRYRYKAEGGSYSAWVTILATTATSDEIVTGALLGTLDTKSTYLVQVQAQDTIGESATTTISLPTERVYMHKAGSMNSLGIGKYAEEENTVDIAEDMTVKVRGDLVVGDTTIDDTGWKGLNLSNSVSKAEDRYAFGRQPPGLWYRVVNHNHVYISLNCAFAFSGDQKQVNSDYIPSQYRPARNVIDICPVNDRAVARIITTFDGKIIIDFVQDLSTGTKTTSYTVNWIDGYLDYWI